MSLWPTSIVGYFFVLCRLQLEPVYVVSEFSTGFYWVLLGFCILLTVTLFLLGFIWFDLVLLGFTEFYWDFHSCHRVLPSFFTGFYLILPSST